MTESYRYSEQDVHLSFKNIGLDDIIFVTSGYVTFGVIKHSTDPANNFSII